jgi:outer membrane protein TolC
MSGKIVLAATGALVLSACAAFSPDGGMGPVAALSERELGKDVMAIRTPEQAAAASERVTQLVRKPLTADTAVQIALLNHRGLQAAYNELGLAEARMVEASLPPNPTFSVERLSGPLEIEVEKRIVANILALATLPARSAIAADRFHQAQLRAAEETLRVALEARRCYYRTVAARELIGFLAQAKSSAETASRLMQRLGESGAVNKLDQAREHVFYAEVTAQLASARQREASERERLIRALGLWGDQTRLRLPGALPSLPRRPLALPGVEVEAVARRVDLQIARIELAALAKSYGLTEATRFVNLLELAGIAKTKTERETGERIRDRGFEIEFQIPIFDFGEVRVRQAEETYRHAVNRLAEKAVNVRSEARATYHAYRSSYDIAGHYRNEVLPLRKIISDETLLRYNAMQIDVFALLAEARQRITASVAAIEAQRDFWLASINLNAAVVGGGSGAAADDGPRMTATVPEAGGH